MQADIRKAARIFTGGNFMARIVVPGLRLWLHRRRSRRHLAMLDDRMLADIGLDRYMAAQEASKPFWRG